MKFLLILGASLALLSASPVLAQTSESNSGANAEVDVRTGAAAGVIINNSGQKAGKDGRVYAEVSSAPSLGGLALGGGHPCAYSQATAQVSIIGGGAGFGGMKVDSACMLMVMGATGDKAAYKAAQLVIAGRDKGACRAMEQVGLVTGCDEPRRGGGGGAAAAPKKDFSASSKSTAAVASDGKCEKVGRKITFRVSSGGDRDAELVACKAKYGF